MINLQDEIKEKTLNKIRRLLALSNSPNEHEAESAILKAQQLMIENGLSMQQIGIESQQNKEVAREKAKTYARIPWYCNRLSAIIANNFRCYSITSSKGRERSITFVGLKNDAEIAKEVYLFATDFLKHKRDWLSKELRKQSNNTKVINSVINDYLDGFMDGLSNKFAEQVKEQEWGLVLVKDEEVEKAVQDIKDAKPIKTNCAGTDLYFEGFKDGMSFEVTKGLLEECAATTAV